MNSIRRTHNPIKTIIFILFFGAVVGVIAWFLVTRPSTQSGVGTDQSESQVEQEDVATPIEKVPIDSTKLVKGSFNDYFSSATKPETNSKDALTAFKKAVTDEVAAQIDGQEVVDPILCTFDTPTKITFGKPTKDGSTSEMVITTYFEGGTVQTAVSIDEISGKITNLQCLTTGG